MSDESPRPFSLLPQHVKPISQAGRSVSNGDRQPSLEGLANSGLFDGSLISSDASSPNTYFSRFNDSIGGLHFAGHHLGSLSCYYGIPIFSADGRAWVRSRTGDDFAFTPDHVQWLSYEDVDLTSMLSADILNYMPERSTIEVYLKAYAESPLSSIFPIIDPKHFARTVDAAFGQTQHAKWRVAVARFSVCSFLTFFAAIIGHVLKLDVPFVDIDRLAETSYALFSRCTSFPPTVEALSGTVALHFFETARGDMQKVDNLVSTCVRLLFNLGLHMTPGLNGERTDRRDEPMRNLFWTCYAMDKEHTFRTGRPPMIVDEHCDLTLPVNYLAAMSNPIAGAHHYHTDLRLSILKAKAYRSLYSVEAQKKTEIDIIKTIRELDEELEQWRMSLPTAMRPSLAHQEKPQCEWSMQQLQSLMLRLEYHYVTAIVHQASSRCASWAGNHDIIAEGISSSLAVSVAASRSTLLSLVSTTTTFPRPVLWVLLFYPISAVLTVFCSILDDPASVVAQSDAKLLEQVAVILTPDSTDPAATDVNISAHIQVGFAREVARLARSAICKAQREG
ncbi:fungal-specific transcription factor domain-containing protein [Elsinoe ampelina]|uniref:Fungal-specific transcription factor domain-containing protein n=1 Tax=Elsinoe ampelina TaxID=302913 RepID=A0A6A6G0G5_9PEZI|nr:fungal-specific transcription factor domain-containing protein [Elsinoe ampelina]